MHARNAWRAAANLTTKQPLTEAVLADFLAESDIMYGRIAPPFGRHLRALASALPVH